MRFMSYERDGVRGLAVDAGQGFYGMAETDPRYPGDLKAVIAAGTLTRAADTLAAGDPVDPVAVTLLPPITDPGKIACIGLNYRDHAAETGAALPEVPAVFVRWASTLVGHDQPLIRPRQSEQFDFEGELAIIIGKGGRMIDEADALDHVAGYSIFHDASVRDWQKRTPQWTAGKNFDGTGPFGPWMVTPDALLPGCSGARVVTRLNGNVVQDGNTTDMVFGTAQVVSHLSQFASLQPGDVIITGTPAGVGIGRNPPLWMQPGDIVEVEIEGIGLLRNRVEDAPR